jgi:hypothetical protein
MTIEIIGILTLAIAFAGIFRDPSFLVYSLFCATLLGSAAAFILTSLGGTNISPAHLLLGFLAFKLLVDKTIAKNAFDGLTLGQPGFWLLLTVTYSAFSAYFMPILFAGQTIVYPVRIVGSNVYTDPLGPSTANFTQSIYLIGDFVCFFILSGYARSSSGLRTLSNAALATIVLNLIFAVLDLATFATGTTDLLSFIRNANYALLNDEELVGFKRIVGSFIEASSFGAATIGYFAYTMKLWLLGVRPRLTGGLAAGSLTALIFSTSTTAYVGLALFLIFLFFEICLHGALHRMTKQMVMLLIGVPFVILMFCLAVGLNDPAVSYIQNLADMMVFNKMSTQSGYERSSWNAQALQTFFDTYGFGAGNGSLRASSFPLAVLGSLGIVGAILFGLFFAGVFFAKAQLWNSNRIDDANRQAAKSACVAILITATISNPLTDMGLSFFVFAAIACSRPLYSYLGAAKGRYLGLPSVDTHSLPNNSNFKTALRFGRDLS